MWFRRKEEEPKPIPAEVSRQLREQALRMATINNAWLNMEERSKGSIEPGKLADLVILSENPLTCPEPRLRDAKVLATIVGGRVVAGDLRIP